MYLSLLTMTVLAMTTLGVLRIKEAYEKEAKLCRMYAAICNCKRQNKYDVLLAQIDYKTKLYTKKAFLWFRDLLITTIVIAICVLFYKLIFVCSLLLLISLCIYIIYVDFNSYKRVKARKQKIRRNYTFSRIKYFH